MKLENIIKEPNKELVDKYSEILKRNLFKYEDKKEEISNSFCSERSSKENSMSDSPIKWDDIEEIDDIKNTEFFFLSDFNPAFTYFRTENNYFYYIYIIKLIYFLRIVHEYLII